LQFDATTLNTNQLRLTYSSTNGRIRIHSLKYIVKDVFVENYFTTICSKDVDFDEDYRFGFNGQEKDNEIKEIGNSLDFGARIYDSRLGKWLSVDRYSFSYPNVSPYSFALNSPIVLLDKGGNTVVIYDDKGKALATISKAGTVFHQKGAETHSFYKSYQESKAYIQQNNNTDVYTQAEQRNEVVHLVPLNAEVVPPNVREKGPQFIPDSKGGGTLLWDPSLGLETETGLNSPASVLTHELIHFESFADDPKAHIDATQNKLEGHDIQVGPLKGTHIPDANKNMDNKEELETITKTNEIMKNLPGENSKRNTHRGKTYQTASPTSTISKELPKPRIDNTGSKNTGNNR